jgi:hypothetical protein
MLNINKIYKYNGCSKYKVFYNNSLKYNMYRLKVIAVNKGAVHKYFATDRGNNSCLATNFSVRKCQIFLAKCNQTIKTTTGRYVQKHTEMLVINP